MEILIAYLKFFIVQFYPIWLILIGCILLRFFIERRIAKRNARIEYENQKQAYKDALREYEKEKEGN